MTCSSLSTVAAAGVFDTLGGQHFGRTVVTIGAIKGRVGNPLLQELRRRSIGV